MGFFIEMEVVMIKKTMLITIWVLIIGITFIKFSSAEKSASYSASCFMPYYVTLSSGDRVLANSEEAKQDELEKALEKDEDNLDAKENKISGLIRQIEKIVSQDYDGSERIEIITTVAAK